MNGIGSYHATVYGVGKAFSNQVYSDYIRTTYMVVMKDITMMNSTVMRRH